MHKRDDTGEIFPTDVLLSVMELDGKVILQGIVRDISERKRAEEALKESEQRLQALMDAAPVAITWADMEGNQRYINRRHYELFGYTLEEVPTVTEWRRRAYPDPAYRETIPSLLAEYKKGKNLPPYEATVTCKNGSQRHVIGLYPSPQLITN